MKTYHEILKFYMQKSNILYKTQLLFDIDKRKFKVSQGVYWIGGVKSTLIVI